jgi:DNA-binding LacI/PurR family transcriptional regulator
MADQAKKNAIAAKKKRLQMQDIAQMAGVSISTVSRALNNSPLVNDETREKVRALAEKLNYNIDIGAQTLRLGNNKTIAVVIPLDDKSPQYVSDPFFLTMLGARAVLQRTCCRDYCDWSMEPSRPTQPD